MSYSVRMLGFFLRVGFKMLALAGVLYFSFFVPLGPRTLYGHMTRIAATAEAHDLISAVSSSAQHVAKDVASRVGAYKPDIPH